ncbi:MAG: penicillin-binding protein activator [Deltaproteobacteria bacterium]|nr:penicillin-binding protein activator [Deltaproteobacteria bacterium]
MLFAIGCATGEGPKPQIADGQGPPQEFHAAWKNPDLLFEESKKFFEAGKDSLALTGFQRIVTAYPKSGVKPEAERFITDIQTRMGTDRFKIGVLLPLTGPFARFGEASLDGISCAIGLFEPCGSPQSKVQIVVFDTKGNPSLTAKGAKELIEKEKVSALIGPLLSVDAPHAAQTAQNAGIPILLLSPQENATQAGDFVFQHSLVPDEEMRELVEKIIQTGLKKFIVIYPQNRYGEQYKSLFAIYLQNKGKILREIGYAPDIPDFLGITEQATQELKMDERLGIFIPDSYKQGGEVAVSLDTLSIKGPKLIGTSRWYHPQLLSTAAASLEGAILDTPFFAEAERRTTRQFVEMYQKAYGGEPAWLEAFGYDAARMVLFAFGAKSADNGMALRDSLFAIHDFPSVVGPLSWGAGRISKWPLDFVTVKEGKFVALP